MGSTKYIKGKDGKFAGSVGEGKTNVPTAQVAFATHEVATAETKTKTNGIGDTYAKFAEASHRKAVNALPEYLRADVQKAYDQVAAGEGYAAVKNLHQRVRTMLTRVPRNARNEAGEQWEITSEADYRKWVTVDYPAGKQDHVVYVSADQTITVNTGDTQPQYKRDADGVWTRREWTCGSPTQKCHPPEQVLEAAEKAESAAARSIAPTYQGLYNASDALSCINIFNRPEEQDQRLAYMTTAITELGRIQGDLKIVSPRY